MVAMEALWGPWLVVRWLHLYPWPFIWVQGMMAFSSRAFFTFMLISSFVLDAISTISIADISFCVFFFLYCAIEICWEIWGALQLLWQVLLLQLSSRGVMPCTHCQFLFIESWNWQWVCLVWAVVLLLQNLILPLLDLWFNICWCTVTLWKCFTMDAQLAKPGVHGDSEKPCGYTWSCKCFCYCYG